MQIIIRQWKRLTKALRQMKSRLVQKIKKSRQREIFTVLDYDTEGVDQEDLKISPFDGELCLIEKW